MTLSTDSDEASPGSGAMFDGIARRYDVLNRLMSFGLDSRWRARLVAALGASEAQRILDIATGTADVALRIARAGNRHQVVGVDPSRAMLRVGEQKISEAGYAGRIRLLEGDAQHLPLEDNEFDAACVAFGIRNFQDRPAALREMNRVVRPGGRIAILELTEPDSGILAPLARAHVHHVVPRLGAWLSGNSEYRYLQRSIAAFPRPGQFAQTMRDSGLDDVTYEPLSFGAVHLFVGRAGPSTHDAASS